MRSLAIDADLTGGEVNIHLPSPRSTVPCFEAPAGGEVVVRGRKLIGSALRAHTGTILQHGAIVIDWDGRLQAGSMGLTDDAALRPQITTLREELGRTPERALLEHALIDAFSGELRVSFEPAPVSDAERAREQELMSSFVVSG